MPRATAAVVPFPKQVKAELKCTNCYAVGVASCDCNKPYLPPFELAVEAIRKNPELSDRAIGELIGVSYETVRRARKSGVTSVTPDKRTGRDGKKQSAKKKKAKPPSDAKQAQAFGRSAAKFTTDITEKFEAFLERDLMLPRDALLSLVSIFNVCAAQFTALANAAGEKAEKQYDQA